MPLTALGLVLGAALIHAAWNIVAKRSGGGSHFALISAMAMAILWAPLGVWFAWDAVPTWGGREWLTLLGSGVAHLVYFNVLLAGYRAADLTVVYPIARGTGPLLASIGAVVWLGESLTPLGMGGIAAVSLGVLLLASGPAMWRGGTGLRPDNRRLGIAWGTVTGLTIALYTVIDGYAVKVLAIAPIAVDWTSNLLRTLFMLPAAAIDRVGFARTWRTLWRPALFLGVVSPLGYVLVLYAVTLAPLSHVAPAREVSMLFAALLSGRLLGERDRGLRLAGAGCIAGGVIALACT